MLQIFNITADAQQIQTLNLPDGTNIILQLYYNASQYGWFITSLTYGSFQLNSFRICNSPNMLNQYRNQIPFGLACVTIDSREPTQILDFQSGNSILYILNAQEVQEYVEFLQGS